MKDRIAQASRREYPLILVPTALGERMPLAVVTDHFGISKSDALADVVFFRDLLISRAIERGLVPANWRSESHTIIEVFRELSRQMAVRWTVLLTPREWEERMHTLIVLRHLRRIYKERQVP